MFKSLININQVSKRVSLCRTTIYDLIKKGKFPRQIQVTPNRVAWVAEEIDLWIQERIACSSSKGGSDE